MFVNRHACKDLKLITADNFLSGFDKSGNTSNPLRAWVTLINTYCITCFNILGNFVDCVDCQPGGINAPRIHLRATRILTAVEGTMYAGSMT